MKLQLLENQFAVCRLDRTNRVPDWAVGELIALVQEQDHTTIVCESKGIPINELTDSGLTSKLEGLIESNWRVLRVAGPLDFQLVGVISRLAGALAEAGVSVFVISSFVTDYLLVKQHQLETAIEALESDGNCIYRGNSNNFDTNG